MNQNQYQYSSIQHEIICFHHTDVIERSYSFRPYHRHNAHEIYLFMRGNTNFYIEQSCFHLSPGDLIITNTRELHRAITQDETPYERYGINIKPLLIERLSTPETNLSECFDNVVGGTHIIHLTEAQIHTFISLFESIQGALQSPCYGKDVILHSYVARLLVFLNECFHNSFTQPKNIMPALVKDTMSYIQKNLTNPISLADLEKQFYRSGSYVSQQFKKHTGLTIREYIVDQKICLAKTLLLQGKNVTEACSLSGFSDYSNFIRSFTKQTGISPGKYRKTMREFPPE